ncbi:MAG: aromatase/cyclase [Mycobacteriales bacterium]
MSLPTAREVEHEITVAAPAQDVYRRLAEVQTWPQTFPPTIYVDHLERGECEERIRIWATANGQAKSWTSRRVLDPDGLRIDFRQEVSTPPVASMGGAWVIQALSPTASRVRLLHHYRAVHDDPAGLAWIDQAVDRNSRSELAALRDNVERAAASADLTFSFTDTVEVRGPAGDVYDFIDEAGEWACRLPHVARVQLTEDPPGLQVLEMDTRAKDGSTHTTKSYRVTFPPDRIAYKQVTLPALLTLHTGVWTFADDGAGGATASSQHTVGLDAAAIPRILGPDATVADAREYVHSALSTNSLTTLRHAKAYVESRAVARVGSGG